MGEGSESTITIPHGKAAVPVDILNESTKLIYQSLFFPQPSDAAASEMKHASMQPPAKSPPKHRIQLLSAILGLGLSMQVL